MSVRFTSSSIEGIEIEVIQKESFDFSEISELHKLTRQESLKKYFDKKTH